MLADKLMGAAGQSTLYVEDVFAAYTRTGTGASATVTTGVDLSTRGGLVISKGRSGATDWAWYDTARGATYDLVSNSDAAQTTQTQGLTAFGTTGHTWGTLAKINTNAATYVDYSIAKAPRFFDRGTYTGNAGTLALSHALTKKPGLLVIKKTSGDGSWLVISRKSDGYIYAMYLEQTGAQFYDGSEGSLWTDASISVNWINGNVAAGFNDNGAVYVWYAFAHDTATDGLVQSGSFTTDGSGNGSVNHGKTEGIQFAMLKCATTTGDWELYDTTRTSAFTGNDARLRANLANIEDSVGRVSSSGTTLSFAGLSASQTYIYLLIAAPIV